MFERRWCPCQSPCASGTSNPHQLLRFQFTLPTIETFRGRPLTTAPRFQALGRADGRAGSIWAPTLRRMDSGACRLWPPGFRRNQAQPTGRLPYRWLKGEAASLHRADSRSALGSSPDGCLREIADSTEQSLRQPAVKIETHASSRRE